MWLVCGLGGLWGLRGSGEKLREQKRGAEKRTEEKRRGEKEEKRTEEKRREEQRRGEGRREDERREEIRTIHSASDSDSNSDNDSYSGSDIDSDSVQAGLAVSESAVAGVEERLALKEQWFLFLGCMLYIFVYVEFFVGRP